MWTDIMGAASLDIKSVLILKTGVHQDAVRWTRTLSEVSRRLPLKPTCNGRVKMVGTPCAEPSQSFPLVSVAF